MHSALPALLAQYSQPQQGPGAGTTIVYLAIVVLTLAGMWKVFQKAGQPGWAAIVPIYNLYILLQITGKPIWWIILFFIPIVNLVMIILVCIELASRFGKSTLYGVGLALLGFVFYPMLGFGDATYRGGAAAPAADQLKRGAA